MVANKNILTGHQHITQCSVYYMSANKFLPVDLYWDLPVYFYLRLSWLDPDLVQNKIIHRISLQ